MPRTEVIRIPCNTGINQSSGIEGGGFSACENFRSGGTGEALIKRTGLKLYSGAVQGNNADVPQTGPLITGNGTQTRVENCAFIASCNDQNVIGVTSGAAFELHDDTERFAFVGRTSTCKPIRRERINVAGIIDGSYNGFGENPPHCAVNSDGLIMTVTPGHLYELLQIYTADYKLMIHIGYSDVGGKVVAQGSVFYRVYLSGADIYVKSYTPSASGIAVGTATKIATLRDSGDPWDVCYGYSYADTANRWWLVYQYNATYLYARQFNGITDVNHVLCEIGGVADHLSIQHVPRDTSTYNNIYIGDNQSGTLSCTILDEQCGSALLSNQEIATGLTAPGPPLFGRYYLEPTTVNRAMFAYRERITATAATTVWQTVFGFVETDGDVTTSDHEMNGMLPISKFDSYGRIWVMTGSEIDGTTTDGSLCRCLLLRVLNPDDSIPIVELAAERSLSVDVDTYGPAADPNWFSQIGEGTDSYAYMLPFIIGDYNGIPQYAIDLMLYQGAEHDPHLATARGATVVAAGQPVETGLRMREDIGLFNRYAVTGSAEIGWPMRPVILEVADSGAGGIDTAGTFSYCVVIEWVDRFGRRHLSEPSLPYEVTTTEVDKELDVYIMAPKLSMRCFAGGSVPETLPRALVYRTVANGTKYQKTTKYVEIMTSDDPIAVVTEDDSDDDLADEQPIYTSGGVLPNDLAPACQFVARVADRIWCGGLWEPTVIQCSKTIIPTEPINFADNDVYRVQLSGECTGLAGMDGRVVAFTRNTIEAVSGDGPDNRGSGYFSPPEIITSSIGCTNYRSVVATDVGIIFQSGPGFFVLPRGFGPVQHIGDMIRDHVLTGDAAYCWASAVTAVGSDQVAAWLTSTDSSTLPETLLVYDITRNLWFMDTLDGGTYRELGAWSSGLALCTSNLDSDDVSYPIAVQRFNSSDTTDDGSTFLDAKISTDTMHPFGVGGWGHVHSVTVVFTGTAFTLNIDVVAEDHSQSASWAISSSDVINHRTMVLEHPKLSALSVDVYDSAGGTDLSFSPLAIVLSVTPTDGVRPPDEGERDGG